MHVAPVRPTIPIPPLPGARRACFSLPPEGALALALTAWAQAAGGRGLIFIAREGARLDELGEMARGFAPDLDVLTLPAWDCLPYDRAGPSRRITGLRIAALGRLARRDDEPVLLITSLAGALQRLPPRARVAEREVRLTSGMAIDPGWLETTLTAFGYIAEDQVDEVGEVAIHGGTVDVFLAGYDAPVRLELGEDSIAEIRAFDVATQRSTQALEAVLLRPAAEAFTVPGESVPGSIDRLLPEGPLETLFEALPEAAIVLAPEIEARIADRLALLQDGYEARRVTDRAETLIAPNRLAMTETEIGPVLAGRCTVAFEDCGERLAEPLPLRVDPAGLAALTRERQEAGDAVVICLKGALPPPLLRRLGTEPDALDGWEAALRLPPGGVGWLALGLSEGFRLPGLSVLAGPKAREGRAAAAAEHLVADELRIGDLVVEPEHGLARLAALVLLEEAGLAREHLSLEFAGDTRLLVSAENIGTLWRYGSGEAPAKPDRLTGDAWRKRRAEVEAEIASAAAELVARARVRAQTKAAVIVPPRAAYARFARRIPYPLTRDQAAAIEAVLEDLGRGRPMNRLICGDVGFGKTEVALHAAAAAALAGKQVAVVAPTTLLARQHADVFRRRFAEMGITVGEIIHSARSKEARSVIQGLKSGDVGVVIGTHALAAAEIASVHFDLIIIDEEQRFGQAHKHKLRGMREGVHALTMTATPLPRTLQAAAVGLMDVSVLATPPAARQKVRSFVLAFDPVAVRGALLRELRRGGQSFVVCPRIEDIAPMAERLREIVPELRTVIAHGRMKPEALDRAMLDFAAGNGDVLLATNIIEAGLDIPNANTMLVWRADRFGLAQLHQLRGRVGRGRVRASAFLLTDPAHPPGGVAQKRLARLAALDQLGGGFAISAADLDLRGAGDLLGEEQAGHVRLIGTELYRHMLTRALAAARGEDLPPDWTPEIKFDIAAYFPEALVPEPDVRLELYRRLARFQVLVEIDGFVEELEDRFGELPEQAVALLDLARLRVLCRTLGIASLAAGPQAVAVTPFGGASLRLRAETHESGERQVIEMAIADPAERLRRLIAVLEDPAR